jgi:hypothetical protein
MITNLNQHVLLALYLKSFENIQDLFTRYKDLLLQLKGYRFDKSKLEKRMVLTILSKLGLDYSVFVSTFHTQRMVEHHGLCPLWRPSMKP